MDVSPRRSLQHLVRCQCRSRAYTDCGFRGSGIIVGGELCSAQKNHRATTVGRSAAESWILDMRRYARITQKLPREIVLLRGLPCIWSKCTFCDYIDDNTDDLGEIQRVADEELAKVTGEFGRLEVINSGSIQELPEEVRIQIKELLAAKSIEEFICESYWAYRKEFDAARSYFGVPTRIKLGVETFDDHLRNDVLNKAMPFDGPEDVARFTDTICLMVGLKGQTREIIKQDMDILLNHFKYGCVNLFTENSKSAGLMDEEIKQWFTDHYGFLEDLENIEVLWNNTDFGVG